MTFGEMCDRVTATLGLQEITYFDETEMVKGYVNSGVVDVLSRTRCTVRCIDIRTLANVGEYVLDQAVLALVDIEDGLDRVGRSSTFSPSFTLIRSDILRVNPIPSEDGSLQIWAVKRPTPMADDADDPATETFGAIPPEFHDAIMLFALARCSDYADDASAGMGEKYRTLYEGQDGRGGRLGQIKMQVNKRGTSRAPRRRVRLAGVRSSSNWVG